MNETKSADILVVDDNQEMCRLVERLMTRMGHRVRICDDPEIALAVVSSETFDVVITDVQMPGVDGNEILSRCLDMSPATKVIVMTAYGEIEECRKMLKHGAFDYLPKPLTMQQLKRTVERALGAE